MKKVLFPIVALVLAVGLALPMATPVAANGNNNNGDGPPEPPPGTDCVTLYAGQDIDVGCVYVWNDGDNLYVQYVVDSPWMLTGSHLYVGKPEPEFINGQWTIWSTPGQFPYSPDMNKSPSPGASYDETSMTYTIPLAEIYEYEFVGKGKGKGLNAIGDPGVEPCEDDVYIAAHTDVIHILGEGCEDPFWATGQEAYNPGFEVDGDPILYGVTYYSTDTKMVGAPDVTFLGPPLPEWDGFQSLGFDGSVVITFDNPIFNGPCDYDISVHEVTGRDVAGRESYPEESADVYIWVNGSWEKIGTVTNHADYDGDGDEDGIGTVSIPEEYLYVEKIKLVDTTDPSLFVGNPIADGYDVDAVDACFLYDREETAWGEGDPFGTNWAMYFKYHIQEPCVPEEVYVYFCNLEEGASVEGPGTVHEDLNISSNGGTAVKVVEYGTVSTVYGAPNGGSSIKNGGIDTECGGFSDTTAKGAGAAHDYTFTFAPGISVTEFSLRMLDFGDYNPSKSTSHVVTMTAYDASDVQVDQMTLQYTSDGQGNPRSSNLYGDLWYSGDAISAFEGEPGNWMWTVSGSGIVRIELDFGAGYDPNIAFDSLCFTIECP